MKRSGSSFAHPSVRLSTLGIVASAGLCASAGAQVSPITWQNAPITACFAPGEGGEEDWAYVRAVQNFVNAANAPFMSTDYFLASRWSGSQGTPRTLTWSLAPDGLSISGGVGEPVSANNLFSTMDSGFSGQGGRAVWINRLQQIFDRWHQISGVTFVRVTSGGNDWDDGAAWGSGASATRGDIRISAHHIDGNSGSNVLAYCSFPSSGDMVLDSDNIGDFASTSNQNRFLRDVVAHEMGHGLGLQHVCTANSSQLMEPFINTSFDGPQQDDIRAMQRHYGDPMEPNDAAATATALGSLSAGGTVSVGTIPLPVTGANDPSAALCSIDASGKVDWFSLNVPSGVTATITAIPVGSTYDSTAQAGDGSCPSTTSVNALAIADLALTLFASNGTTILGTSNATGAGASEAMIGVALSSGTYYIRVSAANSPTQSQLYRLSVSADAAPVCPSFTQQPAGDTVCAFEAVTFTVAVTGSPTPTLQWKHDNVDIPGATGASYGILTAQPSDAGAYVCVATNACGPVSSTPAQLVVQTAPVFSLQPSNQTVASGAPVTFTAAVSAATTLQWYHDDNAVPGATTATLNIAAAAPSDAGVYRLSADSDCGTTDSQNATLTVNAAPACYANCDHSTAVPFLNVADFSCFLQAYGNASAYANCDGSTTVPILNVADFSCFLQQYAAGCSAP